MILIRENTQLVDEYPALIGRHAELYISAGRVLLQLYAARDAVAGVDAGIGFELHRSRLAEVFAVVGDRNGYFRGSVNSRAAAPERADLEAVYRFFGPAEVDRELGRTEESRPRRVVISGLAERAVG